MIFRYQDFSTAINTVSGAVAKKTTIPALEHIKVDYKDDQAVFTATDLENTIIYKFEVMEEFPTFMLEADKINKIIRVLNKVEDVSLEITPDKIVLKQGKDKYQISNMDAENFPMNPSNDDFKHVGAFDLRLTRAISKASHYTSNDELRPIMCGACLFFDKEAMRVVATDAHRLIEVKLDFTKQEDAEYSQNIVIPNHGLSLVMKLMQSAYDVFDSPNMIAFKNTNTTLIITKVDGKFPNYKAVIPSDNNNNFKVNTKEFISALAKASVNANMVTHSGKFVVNKDHVTIESVDLDFGQSSEIIIAAEIESSETMFGLNLNFAQIVIKDIENEDVTLQYSTPGRAIVIEEETEEAQTLLLLMPVLVN